MPHAVHNCGLKDDTRTSSILKRAKPTAHNWCKRQLLKMIMVSAVHPRTGIYFKSPVEIKREKIRHLELKNPWVIHPLSEFRLYYEMWLCLLYTWALIVKPIDSAFSSKKELFAGYRVLSLTCDVLCWIDILIIFNTGYIDIKKQIELRCEKIFWHYVLGPFFICDIISSFPKSMIFMMSEKSSDVLRGIVNLILYLKVVRLITLLNVIKILQEYWEIEESLAFVSFKSLSGLSIVIHYFGCLQVTLPIVFGRFFKWIDVTPCWIYQLNLMESTFSVRYIHAYFRAAAYIFDIRIKDTYTLTINIDYILLIIHYFVGKILVTAIWVILALTILNLKSSRIKYEEVLNQLQEFMNNKNLPVQVREKFVKYYKYKYKKKYVNEKLILDLLPSSLKDDINRHTCKMLVEKLYIFSSMSTNMISQIISKMKTEIYLPGDTIFMSGSFGDAMYFILSGTVAVYTHSGKEVYHLEDGAYFGEVSLIFKRRNLISVLAIESTTIYKLSKKYFDKYVASNKTLYEKIKAEADLRKNFISEIEKQYKKKLFAEEFGAGKSAVSLLGVASTSSYESSRIKKV